jgi:hypothetical protein
MRVVGFLSMVAVGLMLAVAVTMSVVGLAADPTQGIIGRGARLDYVSLLLGLALGLSISNLGRIHWGDLPRRVANWLLANERNCYRVAWAAILLGILLFY